MTPERTDIGRERRKYLRIPRLLLILYVEENRREPDPGIIVDLGIGGAKLLTRKSLTENRTITLTMELEEDHPLQVMGKIVWSRSIAEEDGSSPFVDDTKYYQGVEFIDVATDVRASILDYLDYVTHKGREQTDLKAREAFYMEHRRYFRRPVDIKVPCTDESGAPFEMDCKALSVGGLMFVSAHPLERDQVVHFALAVQGTVMPLLGSVVWISLLAGGKLLCGGAQAPEFDGAKAFAHLVSLVRFGPRMIGSPGHARAVTYLEEQLRALGLTPVSQRFTAATPLGPRSFTNLVADLKGTTDRTVIVASHYDTLMIRTYPFLGANDGASGNAVLLEIARIFSHRSVRPTLRFIFFDGEEALVRWSGRDSCYGSRHYASTLKAQGKVDEVLAMILLDMVGDADLCLELDACSDERLQRLVWERAAKLGLKGFGSRRMTVEDDHLPFVELGIPSLDLIDFAYGRGGLDNSYWHTADDSLDHVSAASLETVGRALEDSLAALQENPELLRR